MGESSYRVRREPNPGREILLKTVGDVAARAATLISFPIAVSRVGSDGYGAYVQATSLVAFAVPLISLGLTSSVVRFFSGTNWDDDSAKAASRVVRCVLGVALVGGIVTALAANQINRIVLDWPLGASVFRAAALLLLATSFELVILELLRARHLFRAYSLVQIAQTLLTVTAVVVYLDSRENVAHLVAIVAVAKFGCASAAFLYLMKTPRFGTKDLDTNQIARMIRFGFPLALSGLGLWLMNVGDRLVVGGVLSARALGEYAAVFAVVSLLPLVSSGLALPALPRIVRSTLSGDPESVLYEIRTFHRYMSIVLIPSAIFLIFVTGPALELLSGSRISIPLSIVALLTMAILLDQWNGLAHYILIANDRTGYIRNVWLACGASNVLLNILLVPRWGLVGAAAVTLLSFAVLEALILSGAHRHIRIESSYQLRESIWLLCICIPSAVLVLLFGGWNSIVVGSVAYWCIVAAAMLVLRRVTSDDVYRLRRLVGTA